MRWPWQSRHETKQTDAEILALLGGGVETSSGVTVSVNQALQVPAVAAAVRTIAESAASLRLKVVDIAADGTETENLTHPARELLIHEANDWTSSFELIRSLVVDVLTQNGGALAWVNWVNGQPAEIIRYNPGIIGTEYAGDGSGEPAYRIAGRLVPRQSILHVRGAFGVSPIQLCREAIAVAVVMERHAARLFGKGARPGGVIETQKNVGDAGVLKMLQGWRVSQEGADNAGRTAVLWDGATWRQMTLSSVDAQFQQLRLFQLQEIGRAFNIPAILLGDLSRATWSNSAEMQRLFLMVCLEPHLLALEGALRRTLFLPDDRKRHAVRFERDDFSKVDLSVLATAINSLIASRVINPNTARDWLGEPPYPEGDAYANPNTGASQPENSSPEQIPGSKPNPDDEDPDAAQ